MRRIAMLAVALAALLAMGPQAALAGGRGDNYERPIGISATPYTNIHHNTKGASLQTGEPTVTCATGQIYHTIWYTFTPSSTLFYIADTVGSDFSVSGNSGTDTVEAIFTYDGSAFTQVACDDDTGSAHGGNSNTSWLDVQLTSGTTYYFQVGSYDDSDYGYLVFNLAID